MTIKTTNKKMNNYHSDNKVICSLYETHEIEHQNAGKNA